MASVMIALLLTVWVLSVQGSAGDMSPNMANFQNVFNGQYDNRDQYQADNKSHNYIQFRIIPVLTPALPGSRAMLNEWAYNGKILNLQVVGLSEDSKGIIHLALYNFTDASLYKPGQYKVEDLAKLKPENLQRPAVCEADFELAAPGVYVGTWPTCRHDVNGKPALYTLISTCAYLKVVIPRSATEESSEIPYNLYPKGDRYKIPDAPANYRGPCS